MVSKRELREQRRQCGHVVTRDELVTFKNGTTHIARTCDNCGRLMKYVSKREVENPKTGRFDHLVYDDEMGVW